VALGSDRQYENQHITLLTDIRTVFDQDPLRTQVELIPALAGPEVSPWGEWTAWTARSARTWLTQGDIGRLFPPSPSNRRRSGRWDDARERNQGVDIPASNSRRHAPIANQAPHRHRQAKSGTCRGREPPHARHTFEVLPPETRTIGDAGIAAVAGGGLGCPAPPGALRIRYPQRYPSRGSAS
jgi:hypothetical protein